MKKILVAYDGGEPAKRALDMAIELAQKFGATIAVVSVTPTHPGRSPVDPWDDRPVHLQELKEAQQTLRDKGIEAEMMAPSGDPAITIEHIAAEGRFDAVVIGSRGLGALARTLQGSTSEHVATHSTATVIVAR